MAKLPKQLVAGEPRPQSQGREQAHVRRSPRSQNFMPEGKTGPRGGAFVKNEERSAEGSTAVISFAAPPGHGITNRPQNGNPVPPASAPTSASAATVRFGPLQAEVVDGQYTNFQVIPGCEHLLLPEELHRLIPQPAPGTVIDKPPNTPLARRIQKCKSRATTNKSTKRPLADLTSVDYADDALDPEDRRPENKPVAQFSFKISDHDLVTRALDSRLREFGSNNLKNLNTKLVGIRPGWEKKPSYRKKGVHQPTPAGLGWPDGVRYIEPTHLEPSENRILALTILRSYKLAPPGMWIHKFVKPCIRRHLEDPKTLRTITSSKDAAFVEGKLKQMKAILDDMQSLLMDEDEYLDTLEDCGRTYYYTPTEAPKRAARGPLAKRLHAEEVAGCTESDAAMTMPAPADKTLPATVGENVDSDPWVSGPFVTHCPSRSPEHYSPSQPSEFTTGIASAGHARPSQRFHHSGLHQANQMSPGFEYPGAGYEAQLAGAGGRPVQEQMTIPVRSLRTIPGPPHSRWHPQHRLTVPDMDLHDGIPYLSQAGMGEQLPQLNGASPSGQASFETHAAGRPFNPSSRRQTRCCGGRSDRLFSQYGAPSVISAGVGQGYAPYSPPAPSSHGSIRHPMDHTLPSAACCLQPTSSDVPFSPPPSQAYSFDSKMRDMPSPVLTEVASPYAVPTMSFSSSSTQETEPFEPLDDFQVSSGLAHGYDAVI